MKRRATFGWIALALAAMLVATSWPELSRLDVTKGPTRAAWQRPDRVIAALGLEPGDRVADVGAGAGYFTFRLADAVGPSGRVYAVEVDEDKVRDLERAVQIEDVGNVDVVLGELDDPRLPDRGIDLVFLCNTYHHIEGRDAYFARLKADLAPGGRVAIVDMRDDLAGVARLFAHTGHWTPRDLLHEEMGLAGYRSVARHDFLPVQIFEVFAPK